MYNHVWTCVSVHACSACAYVHTCMEHVYVSLCVLSTCACICPCMFTCVHAYACVCMGSFIFPPLAHMFPEVAEFQALAALAREPYPLSVSPA